MKTGRRIFVSSFLPVFAIALGMAKSFFAKKPQRRGLPSNYPQAPDAGNPGGPQDDIPIPSLPDPKAQLKENQKNLRKDADRLLELAKELKEQADKTEQTDVLSLSLVKKAEEVEKLARQIKDLARSS
jgi:hypothetical protein